MSMKVCGLMLLLLGITVAGCGPDEKEKQVIAQLTSEMKPHCVGRYRVELPASFVWSAHPMVMLYYGRDADHSVVEVDVIDPDSDPEKFQAGVDRRAGLIAEAINNDTGRSMLLGNTRWNESRRLLEFYNSKLIARSRIYEIHMLVDDAHIRIKATSYPEDGDTVLPRLQRIAGQIHPIGAEEAALGPGFCLGPVLLTTDHDYEIISTFAQDTVRRDVKFDIYTSNFPSGSETLSERIAMARDLAGHTMKVLRHRPLQVAGMPAEEALFKFFFPEDRAELSFALWIEPATPSFVTPSVNWGMDTGNDIQDGFVYDPLYYGIDETDYSLPPPLTVSSSLSDQEAMGLWDAVVARMRPRPGATDESQ